MPQYSLVRGEVCSLIGLFLAGEGWCHHGFGGIGLKKSHYCLKVFCLAQLSLFWSFGSTQQVFVRLLCLCPLFISRLLAFQLQHRRPKEKLANSPPGHSLDPEIPSGLLLSAFWSLLMFYVKCSGFFVVLSWRNMEKYVSTPLSQKWKSFKFDKHHQ